MGSLPRKWLKLLSKTAGNKKTKFNKQLLVMWDVWTLIRASTSSSTHRLVNVDLTLRGKNQEQVLDTVGQQEQWEL